MALKIPRGLGKLLPWGIGLGVAAVAWEKVIHPSLNTIETGAQAALTNFGVNLGSAGSQHGAGASSGLTLPPAGPSYSDAEGWAAQYGYPISAVWLYVQAVQHLPTSTSEFCFWASQNGLGPICGAAQATPVQTTTSTTTTTATTTTPAPAAGTDPIPPGLDWSNVANPDAIAFLQSIASKYALGGNLSGIVYYHLNHGVFPTSAAQLAAG